MPYYTKIKIRPADSLFSKYIRTRDGRCQLRAHCLGLETYKELQCAHFHSRRKESVRFDPSNAVALCGKCHHFVDQTEEGKKYFKVFMKERLGERTYDILELCSNTPQKKDDVLTLLYLKGLVKELESSLPHSEVVA